MCKLFKTVITILLGIVMLTTCGLAFANEDEAPRKTMKQRIAEMQMDTSAQLNFVFYLDTDGHANYEQKVLDKIITVIQSKLPSYAYLYADSQFLGDFDLYREEKYDKIMGQLQATDPAYAMIANNTVPFAGTPKVKMTKEIIDEFLETTNYDGMIIVRIDKVSEKAGVNYANLALFGFGGTNTKVEMDVTTRVFNKHSAKGYVFNNRQRVVGKVHGTWAPDTASRKAIPLAMKNIDEINVQ